MKVIHPEISLPLSEYRLRQEKLRAEMRLRGLRAVIMLNNRFVTYFTGLDCAPTERPIGLLLPLDTDPAMVTTKLEEAHIRESLP